uniref:CDPK adapter protein 1 n=1 Tax=Solanum tuberosum TaxID=4113 RepID=M1CYL2_SOLTU
MSAKDEVGESRAHVVYNGSASRINEIRFQLYLVSEYDSGEGLPYAPVDWPNAGDKWGWRTGKRVTSLDGYICGHVYHIYCALRAYMAGTVGESINLDAQYLCRYCDSRMDLVPHALKLLNTCTYVASRADIGKISNFDICIMRGSPKRSGKELLHHIESIKAKTKGVCIQDASKKDSCVDSIGNFYALLSSCFC